MATGTPNRKINKQARSYGIQYEGKKPEDEILSMRRLAIEPVEIAADGVHLYQGDNLGVMLSMLDEGWSGRFRCIYVDPPYATQMSFHDRNCDHAYDDVHAGAEFIEFMRERLVVARELLADDGSIFVHLDQTMIFEIKLVMDEVFGPDRFRNFLTRKKCNPKNYTRKSFGNISDHILLYSKSNTSVWHRPHEPWSEDRIAKEYPCVESDGRRYKKVPVHAPGIRNGETGKPWRGKMPPKGKHWQYVPSKLDEFDAKGEIYWSPSGNPRRKVYLDRAKGVPYQDLLLGFKDAHNQNIKITGYPTEKNLDLVRMLIESSSNPGDWVLDFFCGSGTTLEAATLGNRLAVGIDKSTAAIDATVLRLRKGREKMGDFVSQEVDPDSASIGGLFQQSKM